MNPATAPLPLREIHLPEPVSWWPPAPGWWGLLVLIPLLAGLLMLGRRHYRRGALRREARKALQAIRSRYRADRDDRRLVAALSVLLRRIALSHAPRSEVASLTGSEWLAFLDRGLAGSRLAGAFSTGAGRVLADAPYRPAPAIDGERLLEIAAAWINALPRQREGQK